MYTQTDYYMIRNNSKESPHPLHHRKKKSNYKQCIYLLTKLTGYRNEINL